MPSDFQNQLKEVDQHFKEVELSLNVVSEIVSRIFIKRTALNKKRSRKKKILKNY